MANTFTAVEGQLGIGCVRVDTQGRFYLGIDTPEGTTFVYLTKGKIATLISELAIAMRDMPNG